MDTNIITYLACICFLFIFGRIFILPLQKILKIIFNSILGGIVIYVINLVGGTFNFHIGLNFFTSILIRTFRTSRSDCFNINKINCGINFITRKALKIFKLFLIVESKNRHYE